MESPWGPSDLGVKDRDSSGFPQLLPCSKREKGQPQCLLP